MPLRLLGSLVNSGPFLPMPLRPVVFLFMRKQEVSLTIPQSSSGETLGVGMA